MMQLYPNGFKLSNNQSYADDNPTEGNSQKIFLPNEARMTFYKAYIMPHFDFC